MILGQRKNRLAAAGAACMMAIAMMLSGCGYTLVSTEELLQLNQAPVQEEEELEEEPEREPLQEEQLEEQLLAVLNLDTDEDHRVVASSSLDTAGSLFIGMVLDGLQNGSTLEQLQSELSNMGGQHNLRIFVYNGTISSFQAGKKALTDIQDTNSGWGSPSAINVSYGSAGSYSAWLILVKSKI